MTWTANKAPATLLEQLVRQEVTYHDDAKSAPDFVIGYEIKARDYATGWPDAFIFRKLEELNAVVDVTTIPSGAPMPPPEPAPVPVPEPPTQNQLNAIAYQQNLAQLFQAKQVSDVLAWAATSNDPTVQAIADQVNTLAASGPALKVVEVTTVQSVTATKVAG